MDWIVIGSDGGSGSARDDYDYARVFIMTSQSAIKIKKYNRSWIVGA
jgi:hypothetical protein